MTTYTITEVQNVNSSREGMKFEAKNLSAAKRIATREQVFAGTVLKIHDEDGNILSTKLAGKWEDSGWA